MKRVVARVLFIVFIVACLNSVAFAMPSRSTTTSNNPGNSIFGWFIGIMIGCVVLAIVSGVVSAVNGSMNGSWEDEKRKQQAAEKECMRSERESKMTAQRRFVAEQRRLMSDSLRYDVMQRDGFRCQICGATANDGVKLHVDHIFPVSKGGKTEMSNLRTLCERCNMGKRDKIETASYDYDDLFMLDVIKDDEDIQVKRKSWGYFDDHGREIIDVGALLRKK